MRRNSPLKCCAFLPRRRARLNACRRRYGSFRDDSGDYPLRPPRYKHGANITDSRRGQRVTEGVSLYEQLFPREATKTRAAEGNKSSEPTTEHLQIPRLRPVEVTPIGPSRHHDTQESPSWDQMAMLLISQVSKSLTEGDFRRAAPRGSHIKDWSGRGEFIKVFPGRDPRTLAQLSTYYLLFSNLANAQAYRDHVQSLARRQNAGSVKEGLGVSLQQSDEDDNNNVQRSHAADADLEAQLENFTLVTRGQTLSMTLAEAPFPDYMVNLVRNAGYSPITQSMRTDVDDETSPAAIPSQDITNRAILFWIDAAPIPSTEDVQWMITSDEHSRALKWNCEVMPLELARERPRVKVFSRGQDANAFDYDDNSNSRWIITFREAADARRFVHKWHRQYFRFPRAEHRTVKWQYERGESLINAEVLW